MGAKEVLLQVLRMRCLKCGTDGVYAACLAAAPACMWATRKGTQPQVGTCFLLDAMATAPPMSDDAFFADTMVSFSQTSSRA